MYQRKPNDSIVTAADQLHENSRTLSEGIKNLKTASK